MPVCIHLVVICHRQLLSLPPLSNLTSSFLLCPFLFYHSIFFVCGRFDQALYKCYSDTGLHSVLLMSTESKSMWTAILKEMRGRLYEHCASILIVHGIQASPVTTTWFSVVSQCKTHCTASSGMVTCEKAFPCLLSGKYRGMSLQSANV